MSKDSRFSLSALMRKFSISKAKDREGKKQPTTDYEAMKQFRKLPQNQKDLEIILKKSSTKQDIENRISALNRLINAAQKYKINLKQVLQFPLDKKGNNISHKAVLNNDAILLMMLSQKRLFDFDTKNKQDYNAKNLAVEKYKIFSKKNQKGKYALLLTEDYLLPPENLFYEFMTAFATENPTKIEAVVNFAHQTNKNIIHLFLYRIIKKGHANIAQALVENFYQDQSENYSINSLLYKSIYANEIDAVEIAIALGANIEYDPNIDHDLDDSFDGHNFNHPNYRDTALYRAIDNGNVEIVKILIEAGANINSKYSELAYTVSPLSDAVVRGNTKIVKELISAGVKINFLATDTTRSEISNLQELAFKFPEIDNILAKLQKYVHLSWHAIETKDIINLAKKMSSDDNDYMLRTVLASSGNYKNPLESWNIPMIEEIIAATNHGLSFKDANEMLGLNKFSIEKISQILEKKLKQLFKDDSIIDKEPFEKSIEKVWQYIEKGLLEIQFGKSKFDYKDMGNIVTSYLTSQSPKNSVNFSESIRLKPATAIRSRD